jgi:hypothetical protein
MSVHTRYVQRGELWVPEYTAQMRGLGDLVARGLSAIGIKQKAGCACPRRQGTWNRWVPFGRGVRRRGDVPIIARAAVTFAELTRRTC